MSGLKYILGDPINHFSSDHLPSLKEVLGFYSKFWGKTGSETVKETIVARELINLYRQHFNIPTLNEKSVKDKIHKNVSELRRILKFKTKTKTVANIERERVFRTKLEQTFDIRSVRSQPTDEDENANDVLPTVSRGVNSDSGKYFVCVMRCVSDMNDFFS